MMLPYRVMLSVGAVVEKSALARGRKRDKYPSSLPLFVYRRERAEREREEESVKKRACRRECAEFECASPTHRVNWFA